MKRFKFSTITLFCLAALFCVVQKAESSELPLARQRRILFKDASTVTYGLSVPEEDPHLKAIKQLEAAGTPEAVTHLKDFLTMPNYNRELKQQALTALGRIGTIPAVNAIKEFELWSKNRFTNPLPFRFGQIDYAIDHFASIYLDPLATATDENDKSWAIFAWSRYGTQDIWLTQSIGKDAWSQPILLDLPNMPKLTRKSERIWNETCQLKIKNKSVTITCNGQTIESRLSDSLVDSDKDELPDIEEQRLLTDPDNPDSDKDGLPDGKDSNPLTPKHKATDDETQIRQAVFSVLFATCGSRDAVVVVDKDELAKQQYYGYSGVVLRSKEKRNGFVNITGIYIVLGDDNTATARIYDYEASEAASTHKAKLKKINNKWVVLEFALWRIS